MAVEGCAHISYHSLDRLLVSSCIVGYQQLITSPKTVVRLSRFLGAGSFGKSRSCLMVHVKPHPNDMRNQQSILTVRSVIKTDFTLFDSYVSWIILMTVTVIQFGVGTEPKLSNIPLSLICVRKQTMASMVVVQYVKYSVHFL